MTTPVQLLFLKIQFNTQEPSTLTSSTIFIREHVMNGTVDLHFVPSEQQLADIFTKPLDESTFSRLVSELGMLNYT